MKEMKELVKFMIDMGEGVAKMLEDGKLDFSDLMHLMEAAKSAVPAFQGVGEVLVELKAMDEAKRKELVEYMKQEFDIPDDELELKIEAGVEALLGVFKLVSLFKK